MSDLEFDHTAVKTVIHEIHETEVLNDSRDLGNNDPKHRPEDMPLQSSLEQEAESQHNPEAASTKDRDRTVEPSPESPLEEGPTVEEPTVEESTPDESTPDESIHASNPADSIADTSADLGIAVGVDPTEHQPESSQPGQDEFAATQRAEVSVEGVENMGESLNKANKPRPQPGSSGGQSLKDDEELQPSTPRAG